MKVIFKDLKNIVYEKLRGASSVTIAVAYFRPDEKTLIGPQAEPYKQGAIVGCSGDQFQVQQYIEL